MVMEKYTIKFKNKQTNKQARLAIDDTKGTL